MNERTISIDGTRIHLRESGGSTAEYEPLVCIHGNLGSGRWFESVLADYPGLGIAPDMPNFGQSDHINEWTMSVYADWIVGICDTLDITRAAVLGHSLGGAVAMELLASHPERVNRLILVDSSPIGGLVTPKEHYPAIEAYKTDKNILAQALKLMVPMLNDERLFGKLVDDAWRMNRDCFIGHAEELGSADYRERLKDTTTPVSVMRGEYDMLITAEPADVHASFFGGSVRTVQGVGHSPIVEAPEQFNTALREILRGEA